MLMNDFTRIKFFILLTGNLQEVADEDHKE